MAWRRLPISAFLRKSEDWVHPEPDRVYQQIRVRLWGKGLTLRAKVAGANIAAGRQLHASAGQFLISRIDARHGASGIVPAHLDGALVSNDFPCFDINERVVMPRYLEWYARTAQFVELCRRASEGSTNRVRLREDRFMATEIPIPPLVDQETIVTKIEGISRFLAEMKLQVSASESELRAMLLGAFQEIVEGAPCSPMDEVAPLERRPVEVHPDRSYPELGIRSFGRGTFHKPAIDGVTVGSKKLYLIREGDLLFNIVFAWEGAVAVAGQEDDGRVGSHRFLTCVADSNVVTTGFLCFYFLTPAGTEKLGKASPGGAGRNRTLGLRKFSVIDVPTPQIDRQVWFDGLHQRAREIEAIRREQSLAMDEMFRGILHSVFDQKLCPHIAAHR